MSKWEFILYTFLSTYLAGILVGLTIACFNRIEISFGEILRRVISWYVMLPAILLILIASAILDAFYLQAVPILLLMVTAYFHPIAQQPKETAQQPREATERPKETERTFEDGLTLGDFIRAFGEAQELLKNEKSVNLLYLTIFATWIAIKRNRDDDTRN